MKDLILKLFRITLGLLGVAMIDSCTAKVEYGCPHADFEAKGVVTDEEGKGIQGIRVVISAEHPNPSYTGTPIADTLWTNQNGEYDTGETYQESYVYNRDCRLMFTICAKQRLVPSVFCTRLINFSFLYLVPAISAGFFVISHTPGYSNPR